MTPWNHALRVSFVCSKAWVVLPLFAFCLHCCNSDGRFATLFEICGYDCCDSSIEICLARQSIYLVLQRGCWGWARNPGSWLFWTADTWPVTFDVGKVWLAVTNPGCGGGRAVGMATSVLAAKTGPGKSRCFVTNKCKSFWKRRNKKLVNFEFNDLTATRPRLVWCC